MQLQSTFENEQKKLVEELVKLQNLNNDEKVKSKNLELEIAGFREDVLRIKKEKKELSKSLKIKSDECEALEINFKGLVEEKKALTCDLPQGPSYVCRYQSDQLH